jgi:hypothetical protein
LIRFLVSTAGEAEITVLAVRKQFRLLRTSHGERLIARQIHLMYLFRVFLRLRDQLVVALGLDDEPARAIDDFLHGTLL